MKVERQHRRVHPRSVAYGRGTEEDPANYHEQQSHPTTHRRKTRVGPPGNTAETLDQEHHAVVHAPQYEGPGRPVP